jgi:glutaconate CoA-transferase subunit A
MRLPMSEAAQSTGYGWLKIVPNQVLECPFGAHPTGMFGRYDVDGAFLKEFYATTRTQEGFDAFAKEWIHGVDHMAYLEKLGWPRMLGLKANTALNYSTGVKRGQ